MESPFSLQPYAPGDPPVRRIEVRPRRHHADGNIRKRYPIEDAKWIWHPLVPGGPLSVVRFTRSWTSGKREEAVFHVSADQRYVLYLDGRRISMGPDRSDVSHWAFAALSVVLPPGPHSLDADVVWTARDRTPWPQVSFRPGFIFKAEGVSENLDTGSPGWRCAERKGAAFRKAGDTEHPAVCRTAGGRALVLDGRQWNAPPAYVRPEAVAGYWDTGRGLVRPIWKFRESPLPEQAGRVVVPGTVRAAWRGDPGRVLGEKSDEVLMASAKDLLERARPMAFGPGETANLLWDLGDYYCAFPVLVTSGGEGAEVTCEWAESLFEPHPRFAYLKGNRDEIAGKYFFGFGDLAICAGGDREVYASLWWRAGRYVRLTVRTNSRPLVLQSVALEESRFPLEDEGAFRAEPSRAGEIARIAARGVQMCAHETFVDSPYYGRAQYVADSRLGLLSSYAMSAGLPMARRVLQLFAWSQGATGFVAGRYPGEPLQPGLASTLLWFSMVRDYVYWRDDRDWVRENLLVPMRGAMENCIALLGNRRLLGPEPPGGNFPGWATGWPGGVAPAGADGRSASVNLLLVRGFRDAALVERAVGETVMASRFEAVAGKVARRVRDLFWSPVRNLFAEDTEWRRFPGRVQCLAVLSGTITDPAQVERAVHAALGGGPEETTPCSAHYLLETCAMLKRPDPRVAKKMLGLLSIWEAFAARGLKTPAGELEPSRSDCHARGSHPLYHFHATVAGVRPSSPGFKSVSLRPLFDAPYDRVRCKTPHPRGWIETSWEKSRGGVDYRVSLPYGTPGRVERGDSAADIGPGGTFEGRFPLP